MSMPRRFGKLRVEVDMAVEPRIWRLVPMHSEQPGISHVRAPDLPRVE